MENIKLLLIVKALFFFYLIYFYFSLKSIAKTKNIFLSALLVYIATTIRTKSNETQTNI